MITGEDADKEGGSAEEKRRLQNTAECSPSPFPEETLKELIKIHEREKRPADDEQAEKYTARMKALFD